MGILDIFKTKDETQTQSANQNNMSSQSPTVVINPDAKQQHETYNQWGARMCGKVAASPIAFPAYLNQVYLSEKQEQANNENQQQQLKQQIATKLEHNNQKQQLTNSQIVQEQGDIQKWGKQIADANAERQRLQTDKAKPNKDAKTKMIIGLCILIPLTLYLFIFYSSAFYSAFFKDFSSVTDVFQAIFDPQALNNALSAGFMEMMFILFAPVIFLGLGFILHFFSKGKGVIKYLKMAAILIITFAFDTIIAYQIGKHIYDNWVASQLGEFPPFSIKMAVTDPNFWTVIFCGFIAYIIWGLVFSMVMDAYENLDLSKSLIRNLDANINNLNTKITKSKDNIKQLNEELKGLLNEQQSLNLQLSSNVLYDQSSIKAVMNQFYTGWLQSMSALGCNNQQQQQTSLVYDQTMSQLFPAS